MYIAVIRTVRKAALRIIDRLRDRPYAVGELADAISKCQSWTSEVVCGLADDVLIERTDGVRLTTTYEATLLADLPEQYALEKVLTGTKDSSAARN